ncbi:MAG: hypothetical protein ACT4PT_05900 [Methanobacteriota archaeon]
MRGTLFVGIVLVVVLVSGCLGESREAGAPVVPQESGPVEVPDAPTAEAPRLSEAPAPLPDLVAYGKCRQFHTFFVAPAAFFEEQALPEGWKVAREDSDPTGQNALVYVWVSSCPQALVSGPAVVVDAGTVSEFWAGVEVVPDEAHTTKDAILHLLVLGAAVQAEPVLAKFSEWGFGGLVREGTVAIDDYPVPGVRASRTTVRDEFGEYGLFTTVQPAGGDVAGGTIRVFAVADGALVGDVSYTWPTWTDHGTGAAELTFVGDFLSGPPVSSTGLAHEVSEVDVTWVSNLVVPPETTPED